MVSLQFCFFLSFYNWLTKKIWICPYKDKIEDVKIFVYLSMILFLCAEFDMDDELYNTLSGLMVVMIHNISHSKKNQVGAWNSDKSPMILVALKMWHILLSSVNLNIFLSFFKCLSGLWWVSLINVFFLFR